VVVVLAIGLGVGIAVFPLGAVIAVAALCLITYQVAAGDGANRTFLVSLGVLLAAYAALDRGVAYVGFGGVYVGELVLALAALPTVRMLARVGIGPVEALILLFVAWGAIRTIPYLGQYGVDAIRDGATWGYALFALAVSLTMSPRAAVGLANGYRRLVPWFLVWTPIAYALVAFAEQYLPAWPGARVPIVAVKPGDLAVHLAVIASFLLVGMYDRRPSFLPGWTIWALWLADLALVGAITRGGFLAILAGGASVLLFRVDSRRFVQGVALALTFFVVMLLVNPTIQTGYQGRSVSFNQLANNLLSVVGIGEDEEVGGLAGNREWRLRWWRTILGYTTDGKYALEGKGFGINLANADGFQVEEDRSLRSPHSAHFTILARGGLTMVAIWVLLNTIFAVSLFRAARRAKAAGRTLLVQFAASTFALWIAALVNMSFDVYLEGPQGGIWFWAAIGFGSWLVRAERSGTALDEPAPTATDDRGTPRNPRTAPGVRPAQAGQGRVRGLRGAAGGGG
jgi:hypothetical protein